MPARTGIAAVVVAYRSDDTLLPAVEAVLRSGADEVVVLDNEAATRTSPLPPLPDRVRVVPSGENLGFGRAVNAAAALTTPGLDLLLVNPDCILDEGVLDALRDALEADARAGAVAPLMRYEDGSLGFAGGAEPSLLKEVLAATRVDDLLPPRARRLALRVWDRITPGSSYSASVSRGEPVEMDWISGFCLLVRRSAFDAVGGFDPRYFLYFEDVDLCRALRDAGWTTVLVRSVSALHFESRSSTRRQKSVHYRAAFVTYLRKHRDRRTSRLAGLLLGVPS